MKTSTIAATVAVLGLFATGCFAQQGNGGQGGGPGGPGGPAGPNGPGGMVQVSALSVVAPPSTMMIERLADQLELTTSQITQLKVVITAGNTTIKALTTKSAKLTQALQTALLAADYDEVKVKELVAPAQKAETAVINASIDVWTKIRSILTADQISAMKVMVAQQQRRPGQNQQRNSNQNQDQQQQGPPQGPPPDGNGPPDSF
ncbi:MAG: Spy/CpxP family protein refolding chaperone [Armatimonadota bacterium]